MEHTIDNRQGSDIANAHPFLDWYGRLHQWGIEVVDSPSTAKGVKVPGSDIILSTTVSGQFAIGIGADGQPVLGVLEDDVPAIVSLPWTSAALLRKFRGRSWLALSCANVDMSSGSPIRIRIFIPLAGDLADRFDGFPAKSLRIRPMKMAKGKPVVTTGVPRADVMFSLQGFSS